MIRRQCANCGNVDIKPVHYEGDTFWCDKCLHRTLIATGKDDLIVCPFCKWWRDRKATSCWWCNRKLDSFPRPTWTESRRLDAENKAFASTLTESDITYWKIRGRAKQ